MAPVVVVIPMTVPYDFLPYISAKYANLTGTVPPCPAPYNITKIMICHGSVKTPNNKVPKPINAKVRHNKYRLLNVSAKNPIINLPINNRTDVAVSTYAPIIGSNPMLDRFGIAKTITVDKAIPVIPKLRLISQKDFSFNISFVVIDISYTCGS